MSEAKLERFQFAHGPVTFSMGFIEADFDTATGAFQAWNSKLFRSVHTKNITGDLAALIHELEPLTAPPRRSLLIPTRSQWIAYLDNFINGTDAFGPIGHLAEILNCRGAILTYLPCTISNSNAPRRETIEAVQFELFGPGSDDPLGCLRTISVARDGGRLRFDASGEVQPFEDVDRYERRVVHERFTPIMLESYGAALGIRAFDEAFYSDEAQLFQYANVAPARQCTIAEARREHGWSSA